MNIGQQLLFFFSALGVFNGFLLAIFFLSQWKKKGASFLYFGLLLLMLSARIGKSVFYYFLRDLPKIYLQIGLSACFFIGPFLWLYLRSSTQKHSTPTRTQKIHLGGLSLVIVVLGLIYPYAQHPAIWNSYMVPFIYATWASYLVVTGVELMSSLRKGQVPRGKVNNTAASWLLLYIVNLVIMLNYQAAYLFGGAIYIAGPLLFSFAFYGLGIYLALNRQHPILRQTNNKYANKKIQEEEANPLVQQLKTIMEKQQLYRNPKLKLRDVAEHLLTSPHQLSQLLNDNLDKSFNTFVNEYRVEAACRQIVALDHLSLEGIGFEVGFSSKSTFYATFKKMVGTTPAKYKASRQETASQ